MAQRLTRGQAEIERRLDLHGTGIEMARVRLLQFLRAAQTEGARTVLVITGKGDSPYARHTLHGSHHFHAPERGGRLRRLVPEWFHEAEFRALVAGFQPAHPKHGGGGAFYVKLRRTRES
jgi:DNA-nicking Smr family endonuclease